MDCIFCKIISKEFQSEFIYQDNLMIIIRSIEPKAKNHFLAIPKEHFSSLSEMTTKQAENVGRCIKKISELTELLELKNGYRLIVNQGKDAGQTVFHLHIHILSGEPLKLDF